MSTPDPDVWAPVPLPDWPAGDLTPSDLNPRCDSVTLSDDDAAAEDERIRWRRRAGFAP